MACQSRLSNCCTIGWSAWDKLKKPTAKFERRRWSGRSRRQLKRKAMKMTMPMDNDGDDSEWQRGANRVDGDNDDNLVDCDRWMTSRWSQLMMMIWLLDNNSAATVTVKWQRGGGGGSVLPCNSRVLFFFMREALIPYWIIIWKWDNDLLISLHWNIGYIGV